MAMVVEIPRLGESITQAHLTRWIREDGSLVKADDPLCELETDKATVELPAPASGKLKVIVAAGSQVDVGAAVAEIDTAVAVPTDAPLPSEEAKQAKVSAEVVVPKSAAASTGGGGGALQNSASTKQGDLRVSPSVRQGLREGATLPETGSGPRGRILKEDLRSSAKTSLSAAATLGSLSHEPKRVPMTNIRKKIAERLVEAQHRAAILTTFNEVDMTQIQLLRAHYKAPYEKVYGVSLGILSFFARALALGVAEFPLLNASIDGNDILYHPHLNLGVAVSTDRGLLVPVVRNVELLSFAQIELEIKRLAELARTAKIMPDDLMGGTFTLTNGGVFGSLVSTPLLNPPQTGILGLHTIQKRPVVREDQVVIRPMMYLALSYDHRLVDGKDSVRFLVRVKELLEDPSRLMLEI